MHPARLELATTCSEDRCSIQLSYGCKFGGPGGIRTHDRFLKRELLYRLSYGPDSCILLWMRLFLLLVVEVGLADQFGGRDDLADFAILGFELVAAG